MFSLFKSKEPDYCPAPPEKEDIERVTLDSLQGAFIGTALNAETAERVTGLNEIEKRINKKLAQICEADSLDEDVIPNFPKTATELLNELNSDEPDHRKVVELIQSDPAIAGNVIKMVNSPMYRVSKSEITSIERASVLLGNERLEKILMTVLMKPMMDIKPIYFHMYGKHIWEHSQKTALAASQLAEHYGADGFASYFLGLVHDVGKIIAFKVLVEAFSEHDVIEDPRPIVFVKILQKYSHMLTLKAMDHWDIPITYTQVLSKLAYAKRFDSLKPQEKVLHEANLYCEVDFLIQQQSMSPKGAEALVEKFSGDYSMYQAVVPKG
ncbi:HDOD domain-containing protein [Neptuniibacter sp. QD37_11]|uniref:HDOD domain-containing protein n=1 Tax=Neptuniibacter sp. QD37_11 TaxID=3398209 RepID=UPI0039F5313C